jgi:hypothetical protein
VPAALSHSEQREERHRSDGARRPAAAASS